MNDNLSIINTVHAGECFFAKRTNPADGIGIYMVVDSNTGIFKEFKDRPYYALNLMTGQIRVFKAGTKINVLHNNIKVNGFNLLDDYNVTIMVNKSNI